MYDFSCHLLQNRIWICILPGRRGTSTLCNYSKLSTIKGKILQSFSWQSKVGQEELSLHSGNKAVPPPKERNFVFYVTQQFTNRRLFLIFRFHQSLRGQIGRCQLMPKQCHVILIYLRKVYWSSICKKIRI